MWDTLCKYTSRVHSITQSDSSRFIDPLSSIMLSYPSSPASLFPHLRKLTWHANGSQFAAEFLRMAFVPSLLSLDIQISSPSSTFLSVISSLSTLCPHLQDMTLVTYETSKVFHKGSPFILQPISQLQNLHTLSIWDLGNQGIEHIMQLQALRSLSLDLRGGPSIRDSQSHLQLPGFHDLEFFHLSADRLEDAFYLLNSLQVVRSKEIIACFNFAPDSKAMLTKFLAILQQKYDVDNLEHFTLKFLSGNVQTHADDFMPLQACRNLTQLHIRHGCDTSISGEELCPMVSAWPKLEALSIGGLSIGNTIITFNGLISLLELRPSLTSLSLVIDTTKLDGIDIKRPGGGIFSKHLKVLTLGNSPIDSPQHVVLILSGLFPYLEQVELDYWDSYTLAQKKIMTDRWMSVNTLLRCFSIVRERYTEA